MTAAPTSRTIAVSENQGLAIRGFHSPSLPSWVEPTARRIAELAYMPLDWDRNGGAPLSMSTVPRVFELLVRTAPSGLESPLIAPLAGGGVHLAWRTEALTVEVELYGDGSALLAYVDRDQATEDETDLDENRLRPLLARMA
jgi:hypothetical protein